MKHLAILLVVVLSFATCKKGADDPTFTLKSRTKRLTGEWTINSGEAKHTFRTYSVLYTLSPTNMWRRYYTGKNGMDENDYYRLTLSIKKDHTFSFSENYADTLLDASGTWEFQKANGDLKNKESVEFKITKITRGQLSGYSLFNQNSDRFVYRIKELRDEWIVIYNSGNMLTRQGESTDYSVKFTFKQS